MNPELRKKILLIIFIILIGISYLLFVYDRYSGYKMEIESLNNKITILQKRIKEEEKNNRSLDNIGDQYIDNAFFDEELYFEDYIRDIFKKNSIMMDNYKKEKDRKFEEITISFRTEIKRFFNLLENIEKGKKFVRIEYLKVKRREPVSVEVLLELF